MSEDLNKSPVFVRLRVALGVPLGGVAEIAYAPLLEMQLRCSVDAGR